jgi:hypothetical protein
MMRRAAGIDFSGHPAQHAFMLADVVLDAQPIRPLLTIGERSWWPARRSARRRRSS